jgi:hypothetical protein
MKDQIKTLEYFKNCLIDPFFEVFRILNNSSHAQYKNLLNDLNSIDKSILEKYIEEYNYVIAKINLLKDKDQGRRAFCFVDILHKEIAKERIKALCDKSLRPKPYNSKNLGEIEIDSNNLASIRKFDIYNFGYQYNKFVYSLAPAITSQTNSSYWISCTIIRLTEEKGLNFKIRLDPFIEEYKSEYKIMFQKMLVYGKPLDWERLRRLKEEEYGQWLDEKTYSKIGTTDFVWRPMGNEIHFTCEELPKINCLDYRGSRFFHAIFDKITGNIKHCDGAIRFYTLEEFKKRTQYHVRNTQVRKIGTRIKIFQIDDFIDQNVFTTLAATFFVWNEDIQKYFGGE